MTVLPNLIYIKKITKVLVVISFLTAFSFPNTVKASITDFTDWLNAGSTGLTNLTSLAGIEKLKPLDVNTQYVEYVEYADDSSTTTIKAILTKEFADVNPQLVNVAKCESRFRQLDKYGNPLLGEQNPLDVGVFQINKRYWLTTATKLGYDLDTLGGNIAMAKYIYEKNGLTPWNWSKSCWGK